MLDNLQNLSLDSLASASTKMIGENSLLSLAGAVVVFLGVYIGLQVIRKVFVSRLKHLSAKSSFAYDDVILSFLYDIHQWFLLLVALCVAVSGLVVPEVVSTILELVTMVAVVFQIIRLVDALVFTAVERHLSKQENAPKLPTVFHVVIKGCLWLIGGLMILSNLGVDITSMVAGLGIGGLAVSLALQNILSDLFSSFSIAVDKPFEEGDFIIVGEHKGTVKKIGMKSTRMTALEGEEIVISNAELTSARVQNYKKMQKRRITFQFGVSYDAKAENMKQIARDVAKIIQDHDQAEVDRVHFKEFGGSEMVFEAIYHMMTDDYKVYMDTQEDINVQIMEYYKKHGYEMAFPTQTVYLKKDDA